MVAGKMVGADGGVLLEVGGVVVILGVLVGGALGGKMAPPSRVEVVVHHQMAGLDAISPEEVGCQVVLGKMVCAMLGKVGDQLVAGKMMGVDGGVSLEVGGDVVVLGVLVGGAFLWKPAPVVAMEVDHHQQAQRHVPVCNKVRASRGSRPSGDRILL